MTRLSVLVGAMICSSLLPSLAGAQDLGPNVRRIKDGIYVQSAREVNSTVGIVLTRDGVVLIDTGQTPLDWREVEGAVRKLTPLPVRYVINTEVHPDHTAGNFVFSPPALVINHSGAADAMRKADNPARYATASPEVRAAAEGYRLVTPYIEYHDRLTLHVGERTFELLRLRNAHSEADTAVWLPAERVLFAASVAIPNSLNNIRPFVTLADMLAAIKMMRALNPEVVVPGHGSFGTTQMFDENERYFGLLIERVGAMARQGKTLDQIQKELRMPEYSHWAYQERMPTNVDAAYRAVTQR
ncbi:MAG: MBL fold metallo-hydrolase [Acidobacteria bacterium]|nr:MBL fold metallo-hydrolase [Acidobacteriota bacterium]